MCFVRAKYERYLASGTVSRIISSLYRQNVLITSEVDAQILYNVAIEDEA